MKIKTNLALSSPEQAAISVAGFYDTTLRCKRFYHRRFSAYRLLFRSFPRNRAGFLAFSHFGRFCGWYALWVRPSAFF
tara:strand:- start:583 stop:816 length:234 start_codon:yes stop_codon:yes gene_type:complete